MRTHIIATILLASASIAYAQEAPEVIAPPTTSPPTAAAPIGDRADWCEAYATWLVAMEDAATPAPSDVRPTHRLEVELNSCTIDPQGYERETRREAQLAVETANARAQTG
jgi:hypothetical protein